MSQATEYDRDLKRLTAMGLANEANPPTLMPKVFAQPFRLAFKKADDTVTWIEVRSLEGLKNIFGMIVAGELTEIDRAASIEMQLWGHLAEHTGFLRNAGSASTFSTGIQPLGEGLAPLAETLQGLFGGDDITALNVLDGMKTVAKPTYEDKTPINPQPSEHEFVKEDGVNLTEKGEDTLAELVYGTPNGDHPEQNKPERTAASIELRKASENAVEIFLAQTPNATQEEIEAEMREAIDCAIRGEGGGCKRNAIPPTEPPKTGPAAVRAGRLVADVARGLDNEADKEIQEMAQTAIKIMTAGVDTKQAQEQFEEKQDVMDKMGVTMEDLRHLAGVVDKRWHSQKRSRKFGGLDPDEARRNQEANLLKIVRTMDEANFAEIVASSEAEVNPLTVEEALQGQIESGQAPAQPPKIVNPEPSPYAPRKVEPASDTPMWKCRKPELDRDPAEEWIEKQTQRGPGSMDAYREDAQREDPYYGNRKSNDEEDSSS